MLKNLILFFLLKQIIYINNYIVLPIETLKKENYKLSSYEKNSPNDTIYFEYCSSLYTELEIGSPPQKIPMLVKIKSNDFIIGSVHPMSRNASSTFINKTVYDFSDNFLNNYDFFNENISSTFSSKYCEDREKKYKYDNDFLIAEETCSSYDTFYLCENVGMNNKKKFNNMYFDLVRSIKDNVTGVLGLSLFEDYRTKNSFLNILKKNNITDNYYWFYDFDSPKTEKGKLIIGSTIKDIYSNEYSNKLLSLAKASEGNIYWNMKFDKVYVKNATEEYDIKTYNAEFSFDNNIIVAPYEYREYFKNIVYDLYEEGKCLNDTFQGCNDFYSYSSEWIYFYCKNERNIKEKLKQYILPIEFKSNEFNNIFELTIDDILIEKDDYIFLRILFQKYGGNWILGKPFSLKYKFLFNPEKKQIGFYGTTLVDNKETNNGFLKIFLLILIIIVLSAILVILGVIIGKKIYGMRKKRANEMNDDDYEYYSEDKNNNFGYENDNNDFSNNYNKNDIN